jgi:uncharacterized SAM-binding protein YcdF (DUF218 family)
VVFFFASSVLSWLFLPATWLLLLLIAALWSLNKQRIKAARWCLGIAIICIMAVTFLPVAAVLIRPLEQGVPAPGRLPDAIDGIIVLGGAISPTLTHAYTKPQLGEDAERLTELIALARQYPQAKVIYSGGSGVLTGEPIPETEATRRFLVGQGFAASRVVFESESRNTYENAVYSRRLARPRAGERWVLITSAFHMPRAYGTFLKAGWEVIPYPVSYRVKPAFTIDERGYEPLGVAVREWIGIAAYRITGKM